MPTLQLLSFTDIFTAVIRNKKRVLRELIARIGNMVSPNETWYPIIKVDFRHALFVIECILAVQMDRRYATQDRLRRCECAWSYANPIGRLKLGFA